MKSIISHMAFGLCMIASVSDGGFAQETVGISGVVLHPTESLSNSPVGGAKHTGTSLTTYNNIQVNHDATTHKQVEVSVAVNPLDSNNLVAAWVDYRSGSAAVGHGYSANGGLSWTDGVLPGNIGGFPRQGDVAVGVDKNGTFYMSFISFIDAYSDGGLWVAKSTDGGATWPDSSMRRLDNDLGFDDKPWIAIDITNGSYANNIYVAWNHLTGTNSIYIARSTDAGNTFSTQAINDQPRYAQLGAMPVVGADGHVFVAWIAHDSNIYLDKSTDGGMNWGTDRVIGHIGYDANSLNLIDRVYAFPIIAASPTTTGNLYVTWTKMFAVGDSVASDIFFMNSGDDGFSWSSPINIITNSSTTSPNDQFFPWITLNSVGNRISIMYYDRSDYINNDLMDVKISTSIDGGRTFTAPVKITDVPSDPRAAGSTTNNWFGDYNNIAPMVVPSTVGKVAPIWADARNGNFDIFSSAPDVQIRLRDTIKYNSTLSGLSLGETDLIIPSGVSLNVSPGSLFQTSDPYHLTIQGKLIAKGTSTQRIAFTSASSSPAPGDWQGIICSGGGPDTLQYCDIKYASMGLLILNTSGTSYLFNDTISSCSDRALQIGNTGTATLAARIYKCGFANNGSGPWTLGVNNARASMTYSRIENNSPARAIWVGSSGALYMDSCRVQNNLLCEIEASGVNSKVSLSPNDINGGYNTVYQHGAMGEIYVHNSASAVLGYTASVSFCVCPGGGETKNSFLVRGPDQGGQGGCAPSCYLQTAYYPRAGNNNISNTFSYSGRLVNNGNGGTQQARYNYWYYGGGSTASGGFTGIVDTTYQLGSAVNTPAKIVPVIDPHVPDNLTPELAVMRQWLPQLLDHALGDSSDAVEALLYLEAFVGPAGVYQALLNVAWETLLAAVEHSSRSPKLRTLAACFHIQQEMAQNKFQDAYLMADNLLRQAPGDNLWQYLQERKIFASVAAGDFTNAKLIFNSMRGRGRAIDSTSIDAMEQYLAVASQGIDSSNASMQELIKQAADLLAGQPLGFFLDQNYPNPFNPTTTISYAVPEDAHVVLRVFNVLGQLEKTVVDEMQTAGHKSLTIDANQLPSGVYFYQLQAGKFAEIKKMLVIR